MSGKSPAQIPAPAARPTRRVGRAVVVGGALIIVGVAIAVGLGFGGSPAPEQPTTQPLAPAKSGAAPAVRGSLDLYEAAKSDFEITTTATGDLRAHNQVEIRCNVEQETTITEIVPEGVTVKKGDVLVKLNAESIQTRLDEESLSLESAKAAVVEADEAYEIQVSENDSATRAAELKLAIARLSLDQWLEGEVQSKVQELTYAVDTSEKDLDRLRDKVEKSQSLFAAGYYSKDQLTQDQLDMERAEAAYDKATLARDVYWQYEYPKSQKQKKSDVDEAGAEVERVARQNASKIVSKEADKKNKQRALVIRQQKYDKLNEQLQAATIKAPSDGLVVYATSIENSRWGDDNGPLQVGSKVFPQQALIMLPDTSEMLAHVKVHETLAGKVRKGMPCTIKIDAAGDSRFTGRVESVGILAEQTSRWMDPTLREYTVKIVIEKPPSESGTVELRPSMRCEAEITLGHVGDAITVPIQAVHSEGLLRFVHIAAGDTRFVRRPVMVGQRSDRFAEIKVGLQPGERVLLRKPDANELVGKGTGGWNATELAAVGLQLNETGDIVPSAAAIAGRMKGAVKGPGGPGGPGRRTTPPGVPVAAGDPSPTKPEQDTAKPQDSKPGEGKGEGSATESGEKAAETAAPAK
jgi:multidrug resistance efflux pump